MTNPSTLPSLLLAIMCFCACAPCDADIITADWKTTGDGLLTHDTDTGLQWLNIGETVNRSYSSVLTEFDVGGDFEGFRYAAVSEFETLLTNAGILSFGFGSTHFSEITELQGKLGTTFSNATQSNAFGIFSDASLVSFDRRGADLFRSIGGSGGVSFGDQTNAASPNKGSWLVLSSTAAVPEPSSALLMGLCIPVLALRRRKRHDEFNA